MVSGRTHRSAPVTIFSITLGWKREQPAGNGGLFALNGLHYFLQLYNCAVQRSVAAR